MAKVVVIGAGASGIIASLRLSYENEVVLLEKNDKIAKKILITGNGHCNYWHDNLNINSYETDDRDGLQEILDKANDTLDYLYSLGLYPKVVDGYYYPRSNQAYSVKEIFMQNLLKRKVNIIYNAIVNDILKENGKFKIKYNDEVIEADKVIVACGSKAYPKTGSEGDSYKLLEKLGHSINEVKPALTSLVTSGDFLKEWSGIRVDAKVHLLVNDKEIKSAEGEMQLTDYGVSGICIFNLSSIASRYSNEKVQIKINFLPEINDFNAWISDRANALPNHTLEQMLESIFSYKLVNIFLHLSHISKNAYYKSLTIKEKESLCNVITSLTLDVLKTGSFDKAQVCLGGVPLKEINPKTMESKIISGLYLCGEEIDVNGECGGYNLAFAFITGYIAGGE